MFDFVIVGAGFAGSVLAREIAETGKRILLVEKRRHIAGNCYDHQDDHGVLIHKYGPHLFHTSDAEVFRYLSKFTRWRDYQHRVLAEVDGQRVPLPFNLNSLHRLFPAKLAASIEEKLIGEFGTGVKVPILELRKKDDRDLKLLADFVYEKVFVNYTAKQWGCRPEDIAPEVMSRVPVFISRDDRYFQDTYQAVPLHGYTRLFENLLNHENIHLLLNTDYRDILTVNQDHGALRLFGQQWGGHLIFTGMIDQLLQYRFGDLPYRALFFEFTHEPLSRFQETAVVNYPNNYDFTRITEFKHISGQQTRGTTILREYPVGYDRADVNGKTPCYPVFQDQNIALYKQYAEAVGAFSAITLVGRLAEYRYYDMDDIVARALQVFKEKFSGPEPGVNRTSAP
jgi:UDP-galactopyranose mutase